VAPVVLPENLPIWLTMWESHDFKGLLEPRGGTKPYLDLMRRTGVNVTWVITHHSMPWPILDKTGDLVRIDTVDFDRLLRRRRHDGKKHFLLLTAPTSAPYNTRRWGKRLFSEQWNRNFIRYLRLVAGHLRENYGISYGRWALYPYDEYVGEKFVAVGKLIRRADPKIRIWANRVEKLPAMKAAEPYIDIFVPVRWHLGKFPESEKLMRDKGKEWWMYAHNGWQPPDNMAVPRNDPHSAHRTYRMDPWLAWRHGLKGLGYWSFGAKYSLQRYSGCDRRRRANPTFIYVGHDGPITSRRLEAYRDGLEDYKLLWVIEQAAQATGRDAKSARKSRRHVRTAVEEVLSQPRTAEALQRWRGVLLEDAAKLCNAVPMKVSLADVATTRTTATVKISASKPVRVWGWLRHGGRRPYIRNRNWVFLDASAPAVAPVVEISGLVPQEQCELTLVVGGPQGQQKLLSCTWKTRPWPKQRPAPGAGLPLGPGGAR